MQLKPTTIFERWRKANSERLSTEGEDLAHLVHTASLLLELIERNPNGIAGVTADSVTDTLGRLKSELDKRGIEVPEIRLPKMQVVRPAAP